MNDMRQDELFPGLFPADGAPDGDTADAVAALSETLPEKSTCTVPEAAAALGVSVRQVEYMVADGTLLASYASRQDAQAKQHARPIVRAARPYDAARTRFLTLEELRLKRSNVGL